MRIGYVPCTNEGEARRIAELLLLRRLIACANIFPITNIYTWKGKMSRGKESVLLVKTTAKAWKYAKKLIGQEHSYECPCILSFDADANAAFGAWLKSMVEIPKVMGR